mgnify:CR=1 FL=1
MTHTTGTSDTSDISGTDEGALLDSDTERLPIDPVDRVLARAETRSGIHVFGAAQALQVVGRLQQCGGVNRPLVKEVTGQQEIAGPMREGIVH